MYTTHSLVFPTAVSFAEFMRLVENLAFELRCDEEAMFDWMCLYFKSRRITISEAEEAVIQTPVMVVEIEAIGNRMGLSEKEFNIFAVAIGEILQERPLQPPEPSPKEEEQVKSRVVN